MFGALVLLRQKLQQDVVVHGLEGGEIHPQGVGDTGQVQPELHEQVDEVHLLPGEGVAYLGAGEVALWPGAVVHQVVVALVAVVLHVVALVYVEEERTLASVVLPLALQFALPLTLQALLTPPP